MTSTMNIKHVDQPRGPHDSMTHDPSRAGVVVWGKRQVVIVVAGRLLLHLAEMLLAMMAGMILFHLLIQVILAPRGYAAALGPDTDLHTVGMALFMTLPMVAWMRVRGHGWRIGAEMAAAMLVPMAAVVVLCWLGTGAWLPWLPQASNPAMYLGMLAAIVYRREHYLGHQHHLLMAQAH